MNLNMMAQHRPVAWIEALCLNIWPGTMNDHGQSPAGA
jgi:hypothetical protein